METCAYKFLKKGGQQTVGGRLLLAMKVCTKP